VSAASPRWVRLTRAGDVITGDDSADGTSWATIGTVTLPGLAPVVQAGMFVTSPGYTKQTSQQVTSASGTAVPTDATATFDRVGLHGGWPGSSWTGTSVTISSRARRCGGMAGTCPQVSARPMLPTAPVCCRRARRSFSVPICARWSRCARTSSRLPRT
jgi:hypothetical protein